MMGVFNRGQKQKGQGDEALLLPHAALTPQQQSELDHESIDSLTKQKKAFDKSAMYSLLGAVGMLTYGAAKGITAIMGVHLPDAPGDLLTSVAEYFSNTADETSKEADIVDHANEDAVKLDEHNKTLWERTKAKFNWDNISFGLNVTTFAGAAGATIAAAAAATAAPLVAMGFGIGGSALWLGSSFYHMIKARSMSSQERHHQGVSLSGTAYSFGSAAANAAVVGLAAAGLIAGSVATFGIPIIACAVVAGVFGLMAWKRNKKRKKQTQEVIALKQEQVAIEETGFAPAEKGMDMQPAPVKCRTNAVDKGLSFVEGTATQQSHPSIVQASKADEVVSAPLQSQEGCRRKVPGSSTAASFA